jgi:hypothetical protein
MRVSAPAGSGELLLKSASKPVCKEGAVESTGGNMYRIKIQKGTNYKVSYTAVAG